MTMTIVSLKRAISVVGNRGAKGETFDLRVKAVIGHFINVRGISADRFNAFYGIADSGIRILLATPHKDLFEFDTGDLAEKRRRFLEERNLKPACLSIPDTNIDGTVIDAADVDPGTAK